MHPFRYLPELLNTRPIVLMRLAYTIFFFFYQVLVWGQPIHFSGEAVDSIQVKAHLGLFHFDDKGTVSGKEELFSIVFCEQTKMYVVDSHCRKRFKATFEQKNFEVKQKIVKKSIGKVISRSLPAQLCHALADTEDPVKTYAALTGKKLAQYCTKKSILKFAKRCRLDWHFKMRYTNKDANTMFYKGCQSVDTFFVYLNERFHPRYYPFITDYANVIDIKVMTKGHKYSFEGKYPNLLKQPWYNTTDEKERNDGIINLKINLALEQLLPHAFLLKSSISEKALIYDYMSWYFERRGKI